MNCTQFEFEDKIKKTHPTADFYLHVDISNYGRRTVFASDVPYPSNLDALSYAGYSPYVWRDGIVTKDKYGLFSTPTYLIRAGTAIEFLPVDIVLEPKLRCECGSWSVGSNRHSSYCPVKE